ncbi:MAG: tRNA (adenosine(37)-N6)-threonylcarbamoyltransferase complex dimerization subunit type 1 TsaB [Planctomycetota bacterium]
MKTLAIDTSLSTGSVAAIDGDRIAVRLLPTAVEHARLLAAAIAAVAAELGWRPADAELVAVNRGPGSFTGLRVGVTTAKALCWATGSRLLGIASGEVIARNTAAALGRADAPVAIVFDAGRGEVFSTLAVPSPEYSSGWRLEAGGLAAAGDWLKQVAHGSIVTGPALALLADALAARPDLIIAASTAWIPTAAELGRVALLRAAAGETDDPAAVVPDYMRPSYADEHDTRCGRSD